MGAMWGANRGQFKLIVIHCAHIFKNKRSIARLLWYTDRKRGCNMPTHRYTRRSYIITLTTTDQKQKTAMRNALWRLGASELLPGLYVVKLTWPEYRKLANRFSKMQIEKG